MTVNGDTAKVLIEKVTSDNAMYKRYDNPEGSTFELNKSKIYSLSYEDGRYTFLPDQKNNKQKRKTCHCDPFYLTGQAK
ncbi:MAG: hypothetical protein EA411_06575 [Saprospirales bacterium]|nr:MAG: hypothetical protein EA411_06575 [Saprospirales bacterium]